MGEQDNFFTIQPEDVGHWDGDTFHFDHPVTLATGENGQAMVRTIHKDHMVLPFNMTPNDFIRLVASTQRKHEPDE